MPAPKRAPAKDFAGTFAALRELLLPYAVHLRVTQDTPRSYYLETISPSNRDRPMFFEAVRTGKAYVSYHLLPLYCAHEMKYEISPALKKRMQGKTCFNFTARPEPDLLAELARLTEAGFAGYKTRSLL